MSKKIQAFLIDPARKCIEKVEVSNDFETLNATIEAERGDVVELDKRHDVWIDDECLMFGGPYWTWQGAGQVYARKALVVGQRAAKFVDVSMPLEQMQSLIRWGAAPMEEAG